MSEDRVVIVAPSVYDRPDIITLGSQASEVEACIKSFFNPDPLLGRVTEEKFRNSLNDPAVGCWIIGHSEVGADGGLWLSDGKVKPVIIGHYFFKANLSWAYLNTCNSEQFIIELQAIHPCYILANIAEIDDAEAGRNGLLLAQAMAETGDILAAYNWVAKGGQSRLRLFPPQIYNEGMRNSEESSFDKDLRRLKQIVFGDPDAGLSSLITIIRNINLRLLRIEIALLILGIILAIFVFYASITRWRQDQIINFLRSIQPTPTEQFHPYLPDEFR